MLYGRLRYDYGMDNCPGQACMTSADGCPYVLVKCCVHGRRWADRAEKLCLEEWPCLLGIQKCDSTADTLLHISFIHGHVAACQTRLHIRT